MARKLILVSLWVLLLLHLCNDCDARPRETESGEEVKAKGDGDEEDSSSEETVEDSDETRRRRRDATNPLTGEQIIPILLDAVLPTGDATGNRFSRDLEFLKNIKRSMEVNAER
ncbi:antennal-specific protein OS-C [Drosophila busckii]|uniref:antennal-specific protein OS-C n=1 Tax=Drosophila busckii TaxID=30019 RepID=UPI00083F19C6|nr:antennal-specific protein OS-C [Drosophila busckii]